AVELARRRQRQLARVRHVPGLLRDAGTPGHGARHDYLAAHQPRDPGAAGVRLRVGRRRRAARRDLRRSGDLQPLRRPRPAVGLSAGCCPSPSPPSARSSCWRPSSSSCRCPSARRSRSRSRRPATGSATTPSTSAVKKGSSPPRTNFSSSLEPTLNSFVIAFGAMTFTMLLVVPAAFGYVRYRFRGKTLVNLLIMAPLIVP